MNQEGNTELVLPIICPKCSHEIDLGMVFSIQPPSTVEDDDLSNPSPNQEDHESEQEEA